MTTEAQNVKSRGQTERLEAGVRAPDKVMLLHRERIRVRRHCLLCGLARAVLACQSLREDPT